MGGLAKAAPWLVEHGAAGKLSHDAYGPRYQRTPDSGGRDMEKTMGKSRREKIEAMLAEEPQDTFLRYSLAMELRKEGAYEDSLARFRELLVDDPPHVPSFFMAGKLLIKMGEVEQARVLLRDGVEQARSQGDQHTASEMSELLMALGGQN